MLGIIGGTALLAAKLPLLQPKTVATPFGKTDVHAGKFIFIPRHQNTTPPHNVNHRAHLAACKILGVDRLILIGSTGGMKEHIRPGTIVIPDDYYCPWDIPTLHNNDIHHVPPVLDAGLRRTLHDLIPDAVPGTYLQAHGPRFETRAEIASFAEHTDIVGMTIASELTLANELGIPVAALCTVDNYANGIGGADAPDYNEIIAVAQQNGERISKLVTEIVEKLA
ncbi:MTAP family purine nucleoside phosphorylase [Methanocorpusculum vombati]|uniref:MTAP family purine nucleoside phosphorylase n=1 Tax=Methanocorpusculum vombati TaxID=3002864 RepID=A0ABT4IMT4_9EURY|nr:MTAP family purine nucleoside phosphorylase [Methanocorpusculum vombati]MCZ0862425.1 MTAP family purine nucleoside phosphorylase [Methanocorpusculum vombati]MDE2520560.1 MTAP family purine nucleoside phosphorylase [Methanocorpusculum sp.]MDE2534253.1 MTAP family purine nucleoside phosphorylase [Methanocorpusculum sp.]MDE2548845.1 MTAP family purine nucleoside phosphorylase [Methanocorpusculum sp.]